MSKLNLKFMSGETCLIFDGKKILKGAFSCMMILNNEFNYKIDQNTYRTQEQINNIINDYIYRLSHVTDKKGHVYDLISSIKDGQVFQYFPLESWLNNDQKTGKKLIALRLIQYYAHSEDFYQLIDKRTLVTTLNKIIAQSSGLLLNHAKYALSIVNGKPFDNALPGKIIDREDPLKILDLQGSSDFISLNGKKLKKGSVASFFTSISIILSANKETNEFKSTIKNSELAASELIKLGFFDFFDSPSDWKIIFKKLGDMNPNWKSFLDRKHS